VKRSKVHAPVNPPVAPVACMREVASDCVVHEMVVPAWLTRGRAKHWVPAAHGVVVNLPLTHWAKLLSTQAWSPSWQDEEFVRDANLALSACASWPFVNWKLPVAIAPSAVAVAVVLALESKPEAEGSAPSAPVEPLPD